MLTICRLIESSSETAPVLSTLAREVGMSPAHLQRVFTRLIGVSPRRYAEGVRLERLKRSLRADESVTDATYAAGYGSSSRVYERANTTLGMTPATYRRGGVGETIAFVVVPSPMGRLLVAATSRGLCRVAFGDDDERLEDELRHEFAHAEIIRRDEVSATIDDPASALIAWSATIVASIDGDLSHMQEMPLDIRATAFQMRVWSMLRTVTRGTTTTYGDLADALGVSGASRAVGRACASNPLALVIPCHRVVSRDGSLGGYRWGLERKRALLAAERMAPVSSGEQRDVRE